MVDPRTTVPVIKCSSRAAMEQDRFANHVAFALRAQYCTAAISLGNIVGINEGNPLRDDTNFPFCIFGYPFRFDKRNP